MTPDGPAPPLPPPPGRPPSRRLVAPVALGALITAILLAPHLDRDDLPRRSARPAAATADARIAIGATTTRLAQNSYARWTPAHLADVSAIERGIGRRLGVVMWFSDWERVPRPDLGQLRAVAARGAVPEITWEPWDSERPLRTPQPRYRLARIIAGDFDDHVRRWARDLAAYGGPVRLRFAHEMNGNWYPWSEPTNGNRPGEFARAWRRVWRIFREAGATNVEWVWSPVALRVKEGEWPGDRYVDRVGLSGFVGGVQLRFRPFRPFTAVFGPALAELRRLAPGVPIEISEIGVAEGGGDKPLFLREMLDEVARSPDIDAVVWFDVRKESDWRVGTSAASLDAVRTAVARPAFGWTPRAGGLHGLPGPHGAPVCCG